MNNMNPNFNNQRNPGQWQPAAPQRPMQNYPQYRPNYQQLPQQPQQPAQPPMPPAGNQPPKDNKPKKQKKQRSVSFSELFSRIFVGALTLFIVVYMGWLYAPKIRNSMTFWPTNTPTPVTPTATIPATATVTPLATNTPTPSPTPTPGPISTYWISNGSSLDPEVPNAPEGLVILSAKNSAEVNPSLDSIYWTSSSQIVQDLGRLTSNYDSEWFATVNNGSIRYYMDQPLKEGLYEIYVMDTYYSSGGNLDFLVQVGSQPLTPMTGTSSVTFMTSQYDPRQNYDTWRSLGIYYVPQSRDVLNVSTSWGFRDEYSYVRSEEHTSELQSRI